MNPHLKQIQNWTELAEKTQWKVTKLAQCCGVSIRTLERHFRENVGMTPAKWLRETRLRKGAHNLKKGSVKAIAAEMGYKHANNFSRAFKKCWGIIPATIKSRKQPVLL